MKSFAVAIVGLVAAAAAAAKSPWDGVRSCARNGLETAIKSKCQVDDVACFCANWDTIMPAARPAVQESCGFQVAWNYVFPYLKDVCDGKQADGMADSASVSAGV
ncbi:Extracellular membrane protein, CFEM domain protein [Moelleriella libera RCEF 2490]|uniref:Extracellular membrane protein, CFEM domain protein n=1 Tax=Moelleriella libera RCEF 2490 TaxID=1081109 RepID=A0A168AT08_9HYPO|nr:Extracellular membrane protein, CFEM domain protein [Moelleriella libera RCEF 2490]